MDNIIFRTPTKNELNRVSAQIAESYKSAYRNMMSDSYLDSLTEEHWVPILQEEISKGDTCFIAEIDGQIVGSVVFGKSENEPDGADWYAIYLSPSYIGIGVGNQLYIEMEKIMRAHNYKSSTLEVLTENHRAIKFYLNHGYSVINTFIVQENGMELECHTMKKQLL